MKQNDKREETLKIGTCMTRLFLISHTLVWLGFVPESISSNNNQAASCALDSKVDV